MPEIAAHLVRSGALAPERAARALAAARDGDLASAALRLGIAAEAVLARALADLHGCPAVDFSKSVVPTGNLDVVATSFCRERRVLPVSVSRGELVLAMADPGDAAVADEVRFVTGRHVLRYVAVAAGIERALDALVRERGRGAAAWRGSLAPALPDPAAAWVGVVHGATRPAGDGQLRELAALAGAEERRPFSRPSPASPARPPAARSAGPGDELRLPGPGTGKLVLVADASPDARDDAAALLRVLGCAVLQCASGRAALDIVRDARPDLVLADVALPMMPGFEVCRAVKGDPVLRSTAVALTSATHRGAAAAQASAAFGADAFVDKPYRDDEVLRMAEPLLLAPPAAPGELAARAAAEAASREGARLLREERVEEAAALLRGAVDRDALCAEAHHHLGHALARQGFLFEASAALARAAELRPDVDAAHQALALVSERLGSARAAREAWARAIEACRDERRKGEMQARLMRLLGV